MDLVKRLLEIPDLDEGANETNPIAHLKFKNVLGRGTWYVTNMGTSEDDVLMFGYVESPLGEDCDEWGTFLLSELIKTGAIFLDQQFTPTPINNLIKN